MRGIRGASILLVGLALLSSPSLAKAQKPRADRPTYAVGDRWIRSDGAYDLLRIENDRYIFVGPNRREIHLTRDLAIARIARGPVVEWEFDPPPPLAWPLEVGTWGTKLVTLRAPRAPAGITATLTWSVDAYEDIRVSAGTFKAFRIRLSMEPRFDGHPAQTAWLGSLWEVTTWYAPEARQFVKGEGHEVGSLAFQIVAVDRPDAAPLQVALAEPKDQARVASDRIVVAGKVTAGRGVARVTVVLNGAEISRHDERGAPTNEVALNLPVTLREGENILLVTAADGDGNTRQEARILFFDKPAASAPPGPPAPSGPPPVAATPVPPPAPASPPVQITIAAPPDQARVEQASIGLAGVASGAKGIKRVVVTLNGVEVSRREERTPQRTVTVNLPITLREGQNTLVLSAVDPDGTTHQEVRTVYHERAVPLTVDFRFPEDRARVAEEATVVAAMATSSKGVAQVRVTLNGAEVFQQAERTPQKSVAITVPLTLREGTNAIVVSAREPDGTARQEVRTVLYDRPKVAAPTPAPASAPPPARWAVVIGVGRYDNRGIPSLTYTVPDAEAVYQMLIGQAEFKKEHVLLLTDKTEKKPTLRNIKWALGTFLARSAGKDDLVVIFYAGHGAPEVDQRGIENDGLAKYLVPSDADPDDLYSTGLPMDEFQTIFGRIEADRVVIFLDSCYSGAAGGRSFASKKVRASRVDDLFLERLTRAKGRAIITASRPAEVSLELPELGHGLFTYYLLQALQGAADLNRDGIVTLQEVYEYVEQQVTRKARAAGGNQHPVMKGELEGALPLVKVGGR